MITLIKKTWAVVMVAIIGLFLSVPVMAGPFVTGAQIQTFSFDTLTGNTTFAFNGFNSSLGTLDSVHLVWTMNKTLNNVILNNTLSVLTVGNPVAVTATSTTTFTGTGIATLLTDTNILTTAGYTGTVAAGVSYFIPGVGNILAPTSTTVGTATAANLSGGVCLSNDASCGAGHTNLSAYIGGLNLFSIAVNNSGTQGGSVPAGAFTGNTGTAQGTVSIIYDYSLAAITTSGGAVPEPFSLSLLGMGLAGWLASRRKAACSRTVRRVSDRVTRRINASSIDMT